jgi:hypothetical protein
MSVLGLAIAFGVFYFMSWPATLSPVGAGGNGLGFDDVEIGEMLHTGLMIFEVKGPREVKIVTVKLNAPTLGIKLEGSRLGLGASGTSVGGLRGDQPSIDALPPAPGSVLPKNARGSIVITFTATQSGSFDGLVVTYQTGWLTRTVRLGPKVTVTVPGSPTEPGSSPSPSPTA